MSCLVSIKWLVSELLFSSIQPDMLQSRMQKRVLHAETYYRAEFEINLDKNFIICEIVSMRCVWNGLLNMFKDPLGSAWNVSVISDKLENVNSHFMLIIATGIFVWFGRNFIFIELKLIFWIACLYNISKAFVSFSHVSDVIFLKTFVGLERSMVKYQTNRSRNTVDNIYLFSENSFAFLFNIIFERQSPKVLGSAPCVFCLTPRTVGPL